MEIERETLDADGWAEVMPIFERHWQEFQGGSGVPFDPNIEMYNTLQDAGFLLYVTVRDAGELVGYWLGMLVYSLHSKNQLVCNCDSMYLMPECRNGTGKRMLKKVEELARDAGAVRFVVGTCVRFPLDRWLERLGFKAEDHVFLKELK